MRIRLNQQHPAEILLNIPRTKYVKASKKDIYILREAQKVLAKGWELETRIDPYYHTHPNDSDFARTELELSALLEELG